MKLLLLDSEFIEYEPKKKAIASAEKVPKQLTRVDNCLVVFVSVEKEDEKDISAIAVKAVEEIDGVAKQIAQKKIVVYPIDDGSWIDVGQWSEYRKSVDRLT